MEIQKDFKELLELLNAHEVKYLVVGGYGGITVHFIGREDLIANKHALGRKKDLADIEALREG